MLIVCVELPLSIGLRLYSFNVNPCSKACALIILLNWSLPVKYRMPQWYWSKGNNRISSLLNGRSNRNVEYEMKTFKLCINFRWIRIRKKSSIQTYVYHQDICRHPWTLYYQEKGYLWLNLRQLAGNRLRTSGFPFHCLDEKIFWA